MFLLIRGLTILFCLLLAATCGCSAGRPDNPAGQPEGVDPARLSAFLDTELDRLGIDRGRTTATAPAGASNAVFDLALAEVYVDGGGLPVAVELTWTEQLTGDYNQDGLVNVSDLTPVGQFWDLAVGYDPAADHGGAGHWPTGDPESGGAENWRRARVDGNGDGLIYMSDITTIAQHWEEQLDGYVLERAYHTGSTLGSWEAVSLGSAYGTAPSVHRDGSYIAGSAGPVRYRVEALLEDPLTDQSFRVVPYVTTTGQRGTSSVLATYVADPPEDTSPPVWTDATGVSAVTNLAEGLEVRFGTAVDQQSPPVAYRVYWEEFDPAEPDDPFDYDTAYSMDADTSPVTITGIATETYYRVAVRCRDSALTPNWDGNTETYACYHGTGDIYPPVWAGTPGIQGLMFGDGTAVVTWGHAVDYYDDGTTVWSNGPAMYRVYYGPGEVPTISTAEFVEFHDQGREMNAATISGLDTSSDYWFLVRARDLAEYPNMDANTEFLTGTAMAVIARDLPGPGPGVPASFTELRAARIVSSPDRSTSKLACVWGDASGNDSWLSSYLVTATGLDHDLDRYLPHDHLQFVPLAWQLDGAGNHELLYTFSTVYETGDQLNHYRQADGSLTEHIFDLQYVLLAGFDLNLNPWVIGYIDNGFAVPYPFFEIYFSYLPVTDPVVFLTSTPDAPQYSYYFHSAAQLNTGGIEVAGRDNAYQEEELRLFWSAEGVEVLDAYDLPPGADTLQQIYGRGLSSPVLSYSGADGGGRYLGFSQGGLHRDYRAPAGFVAGDDQYRERTAASLDRVAFSTCLTSADWYGFEGPVALNTVQFWDGEDTVTVPLVNGLATAAEVETVAILGDGRFGWVWRGAEGRPWQVRIGEIGAD